MPRVGPLRSVLRHARAPKPVAANLQKAAPPSPTPKTDEEKYPDPDAYSPHMQKLFNMFQADVEAGRPHFAIGGKEVYFPWSPVTLLPPSAKLTPYQAQFQVPKSFNKLDLRDYLWHVYGLRALNVTTQIKWSEWKRTGMQRYRTPQVKKMIIEMEQPFVWPEADKEVWDMHFVGAERELGRYELEMNDRKGSDLRKPVKAFDGILGPYPDPPKPFVSRRAEARLKNQKASAEAQDKKRSDEATISRFLKL